MSLPVVALTFDDGPSEWTPALLRVLDRHEARATFFVLGSKIKSREDTLLAMSACGHEIGVHGWDHTPVEALEREELQEALAVTVALISNTVNVTPRWWRPPWNRADSTAVVAAASAGLPSWCGVTLDGYDVSRGEEAVVQTVLANLRAGAIIGLHDGIANNGEQYLKDRLGTVRAVDRILEHCRSVTVSELLS